MFLTRILPQVLGFEPKLVNSCPKLSHCSTTRLRRGYKSRAENLSPHSAAGLLHEQPLQLPPTRPDSLSHHHDGAAAGNIAFSIN